MKKILIAIGTLGVMSFTTNQLYLGTQLLAAMDNLTDLQEWIQEDVKQGKMSQEWGEFYQEKLDETNSFIQDFYEKQCR
tara:strand:- start:159 stop:395 length:237 start_codon:yes stop_codon:yes gene_type:complete